MGYTDCTLWLLLLVEYVTTQSACLGNRLLACKHSAACGLPQYTAGKQTLMSVIVLGMYATVYLLWHLDCTKPETGRHKSFHESDLAS